MPRELENRRIVARHCPPGRVKEQDDGGQNVCAVEIAGFKVPKKILWTDAPLPRTPTGKETKFVLVEQYSSK